MPIHLNAGSATLLGAALLGAVHADAASVQQTFNFPELVYYDAATASDVRQEDLIANFNTFDTSLGQFTQVKIEWVYNFLVTVNSQVDGNGGGGSASGPLFINTMQFSGDGSGTGADGPGIFEVPFTADGEFTLTEQTNLAWFNAFLDSSGQEVDIIWRADVRVVINEPQTSVTLTRQDTSFLTLTYTYIPEPASASLAALCAPAFLRRRARRVV